MKKARFVSLISALVLGSTLSTVQAENHCNACGEQKGSVHNFWEYCVDMTYLGGGSYECIRTGTAFHQQFVDGVLVISQYEPATNARCDICDFN